MRNAFTLAETLITLVIIGVVAAITIPTLTADYQEKERIAKVKKMYSSLANAMTMVKAQGGSPDLNDVRDDNMADLTDWFDTYIKRNMVVVKTCYNSRGCWSSKGVKLMNKGNHAYNNVGLGWGHAIISAVLNDGTYICIDPLANGNIYGYYKVRVNNPSGAGVVITFDINGEKGPNVMGRDVFISVFTDEGYVPAYKHATQEQIKQDCSASGQGFSCLVKYLKNSA